MTPDTIASNAADVFECADAFLAAQAAIAKLRVSESVWRKCQDDGAVDAYIRARHRAVLEFAIAHCPFEGWQSRMAFLKRVSALVPELAPRCKTHMDRIVEAGRPYGECVVCGSELARGHECPPSPRDAQMRRGREDAPRTPPEAARLHEGLEMLDDEVH